MTGETALLIAFGLLVLGGVALFAVRAARRPEAIDFDRLPSRYPRYDHKTGRWPAGTIEAMEADKRRALAAEENVDDSAWGDPESIWGGDSGDTTGARPVARSEKSPHDGA